MLIVAYPSPLGGGIKNYSLMYKRESLVGSYFTVTTLEISAIFEAHAGNGKIKIVIDFLRRDSKSF
jgi:hypothetical protein